MNRLKLKSIYPSFDNFSTFCFTVISEFYPKLVTDIPNLTSIKAELERYVFKPLYRQYKNATCKYLPTEEGIEAFNNQFSNQLEEVVFDFLVYTSTNLEYFNEAYTLVGQNLEQGVTTINAPINQQIENTKSNTTIAKGATAQNINLMVYNGKTTWRNAFSSYYTPQRKAELIKRFSWLFVELYVICDDGVTLIELTEELDFSTGNVVITPTDNEILRKVIVEKPETLIPENIKIGVNIAGIVGNLENIIFNNGVFVGIKNLYVFSTVERDTDFSTDYGETYQRCLFNFTGGEYVSFSQINSYGVKFSLNEDVYFSIILLTSNGTFSFEGINDTIVLQLDETGTKFMALNKGLNDCQVRLLS